MLIPLYAVYYVTVVICNLVTVMYNIGNNPKLLFSKS